MFQRGEEVLRRLAVLCGTTHTLLQPGPHVLAQEGFAAEPIASAGLPSSVTIVLFVIDITSCELYILKL